MSDPIATAADLWARLGETGDDARATALISDAQALCESIIDPLPDAAKGLVLQIALRAYINPPGVAQEIAGPTSVTYRSNDVYLTKSDKATLRRMAGKGGVYIADPTPDDAGECLAWWDYDHPFAAQHWRWEIR